MLEKQAQRDLDRKNDELFANQAANRISYMDDLDRKAKMKQQEVK